MKHIMAVGAHIGDAELTCGKTLATHSIKGDKITTVARTAGERGAPPGKNHNEFAQYNITCAMEFANALGGNFICLNYPDGEVPDNDDLRYKICDIIRKEKPTAILTHWHKSLHRDHIITSRAVEDAIFYAALRGFERDGLEPHWSRGPFYAENWEDATDFEPYIFNNVSEGYNLWLEHIQKLWLTNNSPWFKYKDYYDGLSRQRGARIGKERAECFAVSPHSKYIIQEGF